MTWAKYTKWLFEQCICSLLAHSGLVLITEDKVSSSLQSFGQKQQKSVENCNTVQLILWGETHNEMVMCEHKEQKAPQKSLESLLRRLFFFAVWIYNNFIRREREKKWEDKLPSGRLVKVTWRSCSIFAQTSSSSTSSSSSYRPNAQQLAKRRLLQSAAHTVGLCCAPTATKIS